MRVTQVKEKNYAVVAVRYLSDVFLSRLHRALAAKVFFFQKEQGLIAANTIFQN